MTAMELHLIGWWPIQNKLAILLLIIIFTTIIYLFIYLFIIIISVVLPGKFYELRDVPTLLPSRPRIVDPANPANNVLESGLNKHSDMETKIHSISCYMYVRRL